MKKITILLSLLLTGCGLLSNEEEIQAQVDEQVQQKLIEILEQNSQLPEALLSVKINASRSINPNLSGMASPVEVRLYQLKEGGAFSQSDFLSIYTDEQAVLKAALIASNHLPSVLPGRSYEESFSLNLETKFIGVIAGFSNYQDAKNKAIYSIKEFKDTRLNVYLDGLNVTISGATDLSQRTSQILAPNTDAQQMTENGNNGQ